MNTWQRIKQWFVPPPPKKALKRHFAAGRVSRLNADWTTSTFSANWLLYINLRTLRARAREMAANSPHFKKFLMMAEANVIGPAGIQLQCRAEIGERLHTRLNNRVELAFWEWSFAENCSVTGKMSWAAQQRHAVKTLIRDGEVLVRMYESGPFGFQLKFINVDYLDETFNEELPGGNRVIMSVEVDANDKPVAYWLTTPPSEINFTKHRSRQRERVPAEEIIHLFLNLDDETQVRGVTWYHASLQKGKDLHAYSGATLHSMKVTSYAMGVIEQEMPDEGQYDGSMEDPETGQPKRPEIDVAPASMIELGPGEKFAQFDPKQPTQNHQEVSEGYIAEIAAGLGVNYFELQGDMAAVNYSSARVGLGESRDVWRGLQNLVIASFCRPVYHQWLRAAWLTGKLELTAREYEQVQNPEWQPRAWEYVDPHKEIAATIEGLRAGILSYTRVLGERSIDPEDHFKTIQKDREMAAKYGVDLDAMINPKPAAAAKPAEAKEDEEDETPPAKRGYTNGHAEEIFN